MPNWGFDWPFEKKLRGENVVDPPNPYLKSLAERNTWLAEQVAEQMNLPILLVDELLYGEIIKIKNSPLFKEGLYMVKYDLSFRWLGQKKCITPLLDILGSEKQSLLGIEKIIGAVKMDLVEVVDSRNKEKEKAAD